MQHAHQLARVCFRAQLGPDRLSVCTRSLQHNFDNVASRGAVAVDAGGVLEIVHDQIEVAVAIQITDCGAEAGRLLFQPPSFRDIGKVHLSAVLEHAIALLQGLVIAPGIFAGALVDLTDFGPEVSVEKIARHAVGEEDVVARVAVEIGYPHGPGPVGARESRHLTNLEEAWSAGVEVDRIAHVLARRAGFEEPAILVHVAHVDLLFIMCAGGHVGGDEVEFAVAIQVASVTAHREPWCVWHGLGD